MADALHQEVARELNAGRGQGATQLVSGSANLDLMSKAMAGKLGRNADDVKRVLGDIQADPSAYLAERQEQHKKAAEARAASVQADEELRRAKLARNAQVQKQATVLEGATRGYGAGVASTAQEPKQATSTATPTAIFSSGRKAVAEEKSPVAVVQAAKSQLRMRAEHGRAMFAEISRLFTSKNAAPLKRATFLGKLVIRIPAALPAMLAALAIIGVGSLAAGILTQSEDYGTGAYAATTLVAVLCSIANVFILLTNVIVTGLFTWLKVAVAAILEVSNAILNTVFGGLYAAVNALLKLAHMSELNVPQANVGAISRDSRLALGYLVPTTVQDCGADGGVVSVVQSVPRSVDASGFECSSFVRQVPRIGNFADVLQVPAAFRPGNIVDSAVGGVKHVATSAWDGIVSLPGNIVKWGKEAWN